MATPVSTTSAKAVVAKIVSEDWMDGKKTTDLSVLKASARASTKAKTCNDIGGSLNIPRIGKVKRVRSVDEQRQVL